jgi:hypothetical protein
LSTAVSLDKRPGGAVPAALPLHGVRGIRRARWWGEALTIAWLCWVYDAITNAAPLRLHAALAHGTDLLSAERAIGIDPEHALDRWLAGHHTLGLIVSDYYDNAHFIVTLGLLGLLWWKRADIYRPLRNALVAVSLVGFAVFWLFPVAPPRMLAGFVDVVATTGAIGSWHTGALASAANELAAMPSLHMAWAAWCVLAVWRITPRAWVRGLVLGHAVLTAIAVLATGNHYVLDLVGGLAALAVAVLLARLWAAAGARVADVTKLLRSPAIGSMRGAASDRRRA